jgi:hypothetical protein
MLFPLSTRLSTRQQVQSVQKKIGFLKDQTKAAMLSAVPLTF